ncbi:calcium/sodium antiporter [Halofilum ochraceum]|uniref:calcium/sodium antiporter n=1 Tax=Halofilum ochraceum TaxID=1611323 RepID=UPI00082ECD16|nr:calcium/sodium antiporter [Halofilum ochraceum]
MLISIAAVVFGLALLVWSADRFVLGASATARDLGVSPLVIGLVIVGFATSSPEMLVAGFAAMQGNPGLGIGNAVGSNIANIALILGVSAILRPLVSSSNILTRELPLLIGVSVIAVLVMLDGGFSRVDGVLLLLLMAGAMVFILRQAVSEQEGDDPLAAELTEQIPGTLPLRQAVFWLVLGFVLLMLSSRMLVWGGVNIAETLGVSDLVIGLTIVAVGTSLPELAAAAAAVLKNEYDLVLGNVIGSNLFNTLAVLGLPAVIAPGAIPPEVLTRDLPVMCVLTLLLVPALFHRRGRSGRIGRVEGVLLLASFLGYQSWLFITL